MWKVCIIWVLRFRYYKIGICGKNSIPLLFLRTNVKSQSKHISGQKNVGIFHSFDQIQGYRCESAIAIFALRVTWNYAYSPFKDILYLRGSNEHGLSVPGMWGWGQGRVVVKEFECCNCKIMNDWRGVKKNS